MTERKISAAQLSLLLFLATLPGILSTGGAWVQVIAFPLAMGLVWLALLPAGLLQRRKGLLAALGNLGKPVALPVASLLALFCVGMAAHSLDEFSFFMTSTVYPNARAGIFLICTAAVCAYAAGMGLEPLARMGLWASVLAVVTLAALAAGLASSMRLVHFSNTFAGGALPLLNAAGLIARGTGEAVLFLLLIPRARGQKAARTGLGWLVPTSLAAAAVSAIVTAALGPFAASRRFPLHTASAAAHFSAQGRMDLLFLFLFIAAAFVRVSLWLHAGCLCLRRLFPRLRRGGCAALLGAATAALSFLPGVYALTGAILSSGWLLLLIVLVPLALLLIPMRRAERRESK